CNTQGYVAEDIPPIMTTTIRPRPGQVGGPDTLAPVVLEPLSFQGLLAVTTASVAMARIALEGFGEMLPTLRNAGRRGSNLAAKIQRGSRFVFLEDRGKGLDVRHQLPDLWLG